MHETPPLALAEGEDVSEELFGFPPTEEMLLIGRALVGVAGRYRDADAELFGLVEEGGDVLGGMTIEHRRVDVDGEPRVFRILDGATAFSNTPCWDTDLSCTSFSPSRWTEKNR